ncbi:hypothetical protein QTI17_01365 [Variovorax sp. J31P179]|uniref:hypothetical protein n=1 Tax=Variovorax sp. J31P179 TaxID=3053508 RepID=UPI0025786B77|nr:hypothetical protein [Variovorax sp. J31P179]MDM0079230.1 hypothetical protein [Variovorax sp. J31P179]
MDTTRVNVAYRPLRICWAIKEGDLISFREAVQTNHTLWGGRFNPIVVVDREAEARAIVEAFRADIVEPIGAREEVRAFAASFPHLVSPFFHHGVFVGQGQDARSQALDVQNAIVASRDTPEWKRLQESQPRIYRWAPEDPLADIFLMQLGRYPDKDAGIDYESMFKEAAGASEVTIASDLELPADQLEFPSIAYLSRLRIRRHHSVQSHWDYPGFYLGEASNLDDLVAFWNLRAADLAVLFVDRAQVGRYAAQIQAWKKHVAERLSRRKDRAVREFAIWWRRTYPGGQADAAALREPFGNEPCRICGVDEYLWNGSNLRPPMMHLGEVASLGVLVTEGGKAKVSFGLNERPYSSDPWFHTQHLVASVGFLGGMYGRDDCTLDPPYVPELNEFYARAMNFYNRLRIESGRLGLIVSATDSDNFVNALPTAELFKQVFALAGFSAAASSGGLIARQLIAQLGGLQGGRVFKIPGARRLIKTHGPTSSFAKRAALQLIGGKDDENPDARFQDHKDLYLEPREPGVALSPDHVFSYLVGKRLLRIGADLKCLHCQLSNWFPIDELRQRVPCQMCGEVFDATAQLVGGGWAYRRSGVLGMERNAQGAVPVVLTLQQLDSNLRSGLQSRSYSVSLDLTPTRGQLATPCEVDFAWLIPRPYPERSIVVIGECKDRGQSHGGDGGTINANDVANMRAVADSFPQDRFEVYILFAKLCAFTTAEIDVIRPLNGEHQLRVILLTERELEPYYLFERTKKYFKIDEHAIMPEQLARATVSTFFDPQPVDPDPEANHR